jgi:hypothetical protein
MQWLNLGVMAADLGQLLGEASEPGAQLPKTSGSASAVEGLLRGSKFLVSLR